VVVVSALVRVKALAKLGVVEIVGLIVRQLFVVVVVKLVQVDRQLVVHIRAMAGVMVVLVTMETLLMVVAPLDILVMVVVGVLALCQMRILAVVLQDLAAAAYLHMVKVQLQHPEVVMAPILLVGSHTVVDMVHLVLVETV
jgi:hypothetical protein